MKDEEMEAAFQKALELWQAVNPDEALNSSDARYSDARYFFWSGSEFGLQSAQQIYGELLKK